MKRLFIFCKNSFENLSQKLPEGKGLMYYFFTETKLLDLAIKEKEPDALLICSTKNDVAANWINTHQKNLEMPLILLGKTFQGLGTSNRHPLIITDEVDSTAILKLFLKLGLIKGLVDEGQINQQFLDSLLRKFPHFVYFKDRDSRFVKYSHSMAKLFGVGSPEELYGKSDFDFYTSSFAQKAYDSEQKIMREGTSIINQPQNLSIAGKKHWVMTTKVPLTDDNDNVLGIMGISCNITEQKRLESQLEKERKLFQELMRNIPDYIYFKDRNLKYVQVNRIDPKLVKKGYHSTEELIGKSDYDIFHHGMAHLIHEQDTRVIKEGKKIINQINKVIDLHGNVFWVSSTKIPIKDKVSDKITGLVGITRDITALERGRQELQEAKKKAEEANRAKSQFLANMSHEIRTPMNGIIGIVDLLSKSKLEPIQQEYVEIINSSSQTLLSLINDILDFSKIESGKMELESVPINIRSIIEEVADTQIANAMEKLTDVSTYADPEIPEFVLGDQIRLKQILTNLISNAVKFTTKGEVDIRVDYVKKHKCSHEVQFSVKDTGVGISRENQKKLFECFSQGKPSITRQYGGTGLGLAISQRLVHKMGGELNLESSLGKGSKFFFNSKFAISNESKKSSFFLHKDQLKGKHVVIVDDNENNRLIFRKYYEIWQVEVSEFENGLEAFTYLENQNIQNHPVDLVLIDMHMPGMDGKALAHKIKGTKKMNDLKLILLTSIADTIPIAELKSAGFEASLMKPIKMNQLLGITLKVMGKAPLLTIPKKTNGEDPSWKYKNKRILIVDDNLVNIKVAQMTLRGLSTDVKVAKNGREAIDLFQKNRFDIILMDVMMPIMDGIEATMKIREIEKNRDTREPVKIVAMTANAFQEDIQQCLEIGMDTFLEKPFKKMDLINILQ